MICYLIISQKTILMRKIVIYLYLYLILYKKVIFEFIFIDKQQNNLQ